MPHLPRDTRRTRLVLGALLTLAFVAMTLDVRGGVDSPLQPLRRWAGNVFGPVEAASAGAVRPLGTLVKDVKEMGEHRQRVEELARENSTLRLQLRASGVDRRRIEELDKLLRVAGIGQYRVLPARVVAFGPASGFAYTVTIDAGERDGLRPNLTVLNGDGLVGRVKDVAQSTATVLLATDPSSAVGIRLENGKLGVAQGAGADPLVVELFDPTAPVARADRLTTFGSRAGAPFVPGIPVGEVLDVSGAPGGLTKRTRVRPYVDFGALDLVGVVVEPPLRDPRGSVLPPRPTPPPPAAPAPVPQEKPSATPSTTSEDKPTGKASGGGTSGRTDSKRRKGKQSAQAGGEPR